MKTYRVTAIAKVEIVTLVQAESEVEAEREAQDRDVTICIHGSEIADGVIPDDEFVLVDGGALGFTIDEIQEE